MLRRKLPSNAVAASKEMIRMNKSNLLIILAAFSMLFVAGCASSSPQQASTEPASQLQAGAPATGQAAGAQVPASVPPAPGNTATCPMGGCKMMGISAAKLASHNTETDCWVAYQGKVYDITGFIPKHKNYQALLVPLCGTSGQFEQKFEAKHGTSKVNVLESEPLVGSFAG